MTKKKFVIKLPKDITKLDLGDTYHGEGEPLGKGWASISLRGDEFKYKFKGNYIDTPFPNNTFKTLHGGCFLEFETAKTDKKKLQQFKELYRILKPGGRAKLSACEIFGDEKKLLLHYSQLSIQAGFKIDLAKWKPQWVAIYEAYDIPHVILIKPKRK